MENSKLTSQEDQNHDQNQMQESTKKEKYNVAINLIQAQVQLFWLIFGAFLLSETVLLGAITSIDKNDSANLIFGGSVFGIIISFFWFTTTNYNHAFYYLRILEARVLEPLTGDFFTNGRKLHEGKTVILNEGESVLTIKIPRIVRMFRPQVSLWFLIGIYDLAFIYLAYKNCPWIDC